MGAAGYSVQQTEDGGYIIAGEAGGVYLLKTDALGNESWSKTVRVDAKGRFYFKDKREEDNICVI